MMDSRFIKLRLELMKRKERKNEINRNEEKKSRDKSRIQKKM